MNLLDKKVALYTQYIQEVEEELSKVKEDAEKVIEKMRILLTEMEKTSTEIASLEETALNILSNVELLYRENQSLLSNITQARTDTQTAIENLRRQVEKAREEIEKAGEESLKRLMRSMREKAEKETERISEEIVSLLERAKKSLLILYGIAIGSNLTAIALLLYLFKKLTGG